MDPQQKRRLVSGGTLIVIGLALFLAEYLQDFGYTAILLLAGISLSTTVRACRRREIVRSVGYQLQMRRIP